jgi:hypothetical protein
MGLQVERQIADGSHQEQRDRQQQPGKNAEICHLDRAQCGIRHLLVWSRQLRQLSELGRFSELREACKRMDRR